MAFSDARTNVPEPKVRLQRDQAPADQTLISAIAAFGELGGQIRKGQVSGNLTQNLARSGNIIATINDPKTITTENADGSVEVDLTFSDPTGSIDQTSAEFQRVAAGIDQGKISEQRGAIEAEVILRKSIARAPGFAAELRRLAQDTLGFNASGAALEALFLSGPDSNVITQQDKDIAEAQARVAAGFHPTFEGAMKSVIGERARKGQLAEQNFRISLGELDAPRVAIAAGSAAQFNMNEVMLNGLQQIRQTGTVNNIEQLRAGLMAQAELAIAETIGFMASNKDNFYKPAAYDGVRAEVNRVRDANIALLENQDVLNVLTRRQDLVQKVLFLEGVNVAPELAIMSQFGEGAVEDYLELMAASRGDPQLMAEFMRINPAFGFLGNIALNAQDIGPALRAISNGNIGQLVDSGNLDPTTAKGVVKFQALRQIENTARPEEFPEVITSLDQLNLPKMVLSTAAQTKNSFAKADDTNKASIKIQFESGNELVRVQISSILADSPWELGYNGQTQKFVIKSRPGAEKQELERDRPFNPSQFSGFRPIEEVQTIASDQLRVLNDEYVPLMSQTQWPEHMGSDSTAGWIADTLIAVNQQVTAAEAPAGGTGVGDQLPTQAGELIRNTETGVITRINEQGQQEQVGDSNFQRINADVTDDQQGPSIPAGAEALAGSISTAAKSAGVDERIMLALAKTENNTFAPLRPNEKGESSAFGLFQMLNDTFNEFGGGDRTDPNQQIANAITFFKLLNDKHGDKGLDEIIVRWHDGQNSTGEPSDEAKVFLARFKRNLDG